MVRGAINYGQRRIAYTAKFSRRSTLAISVLPDSSVELVAPVGTEQRELERRLRKRARWVSRQLDYFAQFMPRTPPRRYVSGESHLYLGRQYRLKITEGAHERVRLTRGLFLVEVGSPKNAKHIRELVKAWYRQKAEHRLQERFERALPTFERLGFERPRLRIQAMPRRWGSHSSSGTITLNPDLIRAPLACIEYVVAHELCHLIEPTHGRRHLLLLSTLMEDWRLRKERLEHFMS